MSKLKALKDYHGMPTLFVTILPDDTHDKKKCLFNRLIVTISLQFLGTLLMHYKITIPRIMVFQYSVIIFENYLLADLLQLLSAEMFKIIIETFFSLVLATPAHQFVKKTIPLPDRPVGIFGTPVASTGFVEEQGKGYLHIHVVVWAGFPPDLLQAVGGDSKTSNSFSFCHRQSHNSRNKSCRSLKDFLRQFTGSKAERAAFYETHNPNNMDEYEIDINRVIASTGIHVHNGLCRKCKGCLTGCRLCRPQTLRDATMVTQINLTSTNVEM
jgi:hypothetical protein